MKTQLATLTPADLDVPTATLPSVPCGAACRFAPYIGCTRPLGHSGLHGACGNDFLWAPNGQEKRPTGYAIEDLDDPTVRSAFFHNDPMGLALCDTLRFELAQALAQRDLLASELADAREKVEAAIDAAALEERGEATLANRSAGV